MAIGTTIAGMTIKIPPGLLLAGQRLAEHPLSAADTDFLNALVKHNGLPAMAAALETTTVVLAEVLTGHHVDTAVRRSTVGRIRARLNALRQELIDRQPDHGMAPRALSCGCVLMVPKATFDEGGCPMHEGGA